MKLKSAVAIAALEAAIKRLGITLSAEKLVADSAVKQLSTSMQAKLLPIKVAVELGHFLIEKDFFGQVDVYDGTGAVDEFMLEFFKTLTDDSELADDAVWAFNKALSDNPVTSDVNVLHFYKGLADAVSLLEVQELSFYKPLSDASEISDAQTNAVGKNVSDVSNVAEDDYKAFSKAVTEAPALLSDDDVLSFFKNTQDQADFTDDETLAFAKFLTDTVGVTDDIDGAASILDDQEMQYFKNTTDVSTATDIFVRVVAYVRSYSDTATLSDDNYISLDKPITDNPSFTDFNRTDFGKLTGDTPVVGDALALQVTLAPFNNAYSVSDSADIVPNKVFNELPSLTDAGSLRSQGYSDFTYFAEDYVGASRTF